MVVIGAAVGACGDGSVGGEVLSSGSTRRGGFKGLICEKEIIFV